MFSFYRVVEALDRIEEFKLDPEYRETIKGYVRGVRKTTKDPVERKKMYKHIKFIAKRTQNTPDWVKDIHKRYTG